MTGLPPKGYVIPRLKAGQQSVVARDGQHRVADAAAGCDSRQQLMSVNVNSFYRSRCKHCKNFHDANSYCFRLRRFSTKMPNADLAREAGPVLDLGADRPLMCPILGQVMSLALVSQFIRTKPRRLFLTNTGLQLTCVSLTSSTARGRGLILLRRSWCFRPPVFRCTSVSCSAMESWTRTVSRS